MSIPRHQRHGKDVLFVNDLNETHVHSVICLPGAILFLLIFLNLLKDFKHIVKLQMSSLQIMALLSGLAGLGATIAATVSNEWRATSRASSVITATWVLQGLWNNCAGNAIGALHCRPHHTIFKLEGKGPSFMASTYWSFLTRCRGYTVEGFYEMFLMPNDTMYTRYSWLQGQMYHLCFTGKYVLYQ